MNFFFWNYHIFDIKIIEVNICSIFKKINLQQNTLYRTLSTRVIRIKKRKRKWLEISNISKIKKEVVRVACNTWKRQNEPCVQWDLSATFSLIYIFFFLFLWSGFSDLYLFFNNVHFFLFFSFSVLIFFFFLPFASRNRKSWKSGSVSVVVGCRKAQRNRRQDRWWDTIHAILIEVLFTFNFCVDRKFSSTMHWENCEYFILHFEYSESLWKFIYFEKFYFSLNIRNSISGFFKN